MEHQLLQIIVVFAYLLIITLIGLYVGRKVKTTADYALAGRNLPGWIAALSERATGESAWALLGLPGAAYALGLTEMWTALGCVAGIILSWLFIAIKLRNEAEKIEANTFMEFLRKRHGALGQYIQVFGTMVIGIFFFLYVGAQFIGGAKTLYQMFGFDLRLGITLVMLFVVPYTIYGGFKSVAYTDAIQALLMLVTLVIGPIVGYFFILKTPDVFAQSVPKAIEMSGEAYSSVTGLSKGFGAGVVIVSGFSWMFGYLGGMPQLATRYMAIKSNRQAKIARNIGIVWTLFAYSGALLLGWIGLAIFGPATLVDRESVMPMVILTIFPPVIAAVLITGVFAAMISTANSLLILSSTEISDILHKNKIFANIPDILTSRLITTLLSVVAFVFAIFYREQLIYNIVKYVWAGIGDTFSVIIILTLFWKKFHARAAFITMISGIFFTIVWIQTNMEQYISCLIMTFVVSMLVAVITTYFVKPKMITNP